MKTILGTMILFLCATICCAQDVTVLNWQELRIDSMLPYYREVVPLESDYRYNEYKVSIEYPEWITATSEEAKKLNLLCKQLDSKINIESWVTINRGKGEINYTFCPIIKDGKTYKKLHSAVITVEATPIATKNRLNVRSNLTTNTSPLATGKWVKISITKDGVYRLTRSALRKMGFANPDNVHLYGFGGHRINEVLTDGNYYKDFQEEPLYKINKDTWLFWGNGLMYWNGNERVLNHYARNAYYFLTEENSPSQISTITSTAAPTVTYTDFTDHVLHEKDEFAWHSFGRHLYEKTDFSTGAGISYTLNTINSVANEKITIAFSAAHQSATTLSSSVNGHSLSNVTLKALSEYTYATTTTNTYDVSKYANGNSWTVRLNSTAGNPAHLDYIALHYSRALTPHNGYVAFSRSEKKVAKYNITGDVKVMRLSTPGQSTALVTTSYANGVTSAVVDDASQRYVAFNPSYNFPEPTICGAISNQNLRALDNIDMVIIIPASGKLYNQAQRLAEAHKMYGGLRVAIVRADEVYNDFSSGTPDATAYRLFMKHLYDKASDDHNRVRYLLLMGDCAWDNRMYSDAWQKKSPDDYLLCYESNNSWSDTQSYVMEDYFGLLDDSEGAKLTDDVSDIGIGRFCCTTPAEAKAMVDKTIDFLSNKYSGSWKNTVSFLGDDGDNNSHMLFADQVANKVLEDNPEIDVRKVMWDAYTRVSTLTSNTYPDVTKLIEQQMQDGVLLMNYTGHGATYCLSHEFVLKLEHFRKFKSKHLPLWFTAACDVMPFDGQSDNIGETAMLNDGGAAVAFIGTARTVYANNNKNLNTWFMKYLFDTDEYGRRNSVGEALRLAKKHLIMGGDENSHTPIETYNKENKLQYALLGDPSLVFGAPLNKIVLDSINGVDISKDIQIKAGQHIRMCGHVEDANGEKYTQFNGKLSLRLYDSMETITCKNNANASSTYKFSQHDKTLYNGQDSIKGGKFQLEFVVPKDILYSNDAGRAVFYAVDDTLRAEANGYSEHFRIGGVADNKDTQGPNMYLYLNDEDFSNGGIVNSTPLFVATLNDMSGINYSGLGLGHDLVLTIDNAPSMTYVLNEYYQTSAGDYTNGNVKFEIPALPSGKHRLTFRSWDVLNNTSQKQLDFVVDEGMMYIAELFDFSGHCIWRSESKRSLSDIQCPQYKKGLYIYRITTHYSNQKDTKIEKKIMIR